MTRAQGIARNAINGILCFVFPIIFLMLTSADVPWVMLILFSICWGATYYVVNTPTPAFDLEAVFGDRAGFIESVLRGSDATHCNRLRPTHIARNAEYDNVTAFHYPNEVREPLRFPSPEVVGESSADPIERQLHQA